VSTLHGSVATPLRCGEIFNIGHPLHPSLDWSIFMASAEVTAYLGGMGTVPSARPEAEPSSRVMAGWRQSAAEAKDYFAQIGQILSKMPPKFSFGQA